MNFFKTAQLKKIIVSVSIGGVGKRALSWTGLPKPAKNLILKSSDKKKI